MIGTFGCHSRHEYGTEGSGAGAGGSGTEECWTSICGAELEKERMEENTHKLRSVNQRRHAGKAARCILSINKLIKQKASKW